MIQAIPSNQPTPGKLEELLELVPHPITEADTSSTPERWQPQKLNPRHREIMRRLLEGADYQQIALEMGLHTQTIMLVATSKLFRYELEKMEANADFNVIKRAEALSNEALDTLKNLMRFGRSEFVKKNAADSILDRAGYAKVEKKLIGIVNGEDVIKELNRQRQERILGSGAGRNKVVTVDEVVES